MSYQALYDALLRARENAREKDWPGDVKRLQDHIDALSPDKPQATAEQEARRLLGPVTLGEEWTSLSNSEKLNVVYRSEAGGEEEVCTITFGDLRRLCAERSSPTPSEIGWRQRQGGSE